MDNEALLSESLDAGQINFTGLGSGTDFNAMVDQLIKLERRQMARLEIWKKEWEDKQEGFRELNSKLLTLRTDLQGMNTMNKFLVKNAETTNPAVLTATASDQAQEGTHSLVVNQLAQNHILTGDTIQATTTGDITSGSAAQFDYAYDGKNRSLNVPSGTTLEGLRNIINSDPDNPGVRASIIKNADEDYRLQLRGMDMGADNDITINASTTLAGYSDADFTTTLAAQNSQLRLDGFPADPDWIERSTNTVSDVLEGVTFSLHETGSTTLNIDVDNAQIKENVLAFVDQVNEVRSTIQELTKVDRSGNGSLLTGNYAIQMIDSRLKSITAQQGIGFDSQNDVFSSLSMIGITTDAEQASPTFGLLKVDEEVLDHALQNRPDELAEIFAADYIGSTDSTDFRYYSSIDGVTKAGEYALQYTVSGGNVTSATLNGNEASVSGDEITGKSGTPEAGLVIKVDNLTDGTYEGNVFLKLGKATEMADALKDLTDGESGPLNILEDNYDDITKGIDKKIEYEERRVARMEKDLRARFARLETLLGYYDQLGQSLNSQLGQLKSDSG